MSPYSATVLPSGHGAEHNEVDWEARALLRHRASLLEPWVLSTVGTNVSMGKRGQSSPPRRAARNTFPLQPFTDSCEAAWCHG